MHNHTLPRLIFCQAHSLTKWKEGCDYGYVGWVEGKQQLLLFLLFQTWYYPKEESTKWHCIPPAGKSAELVMGNCEHWADIVPQWPERVNALSRSSNLQLGRIWALRGRLNRSIFIHCEFNDRSSLLWSKLTHQIMHSDNWITNPLTYCRISAM